MPTGFWVMAPAMSPLLIASIWSLPESKPMIVSFPSIPSSWTAWTTPMAAPSLEPYRPLRSVGRDDRLRQVGRLQRVAAVLDVDDLDVGLVVLHVVDEPVAALHTGNARLVMHDHGDLAGV